MTQFQPSASLTTGCDLRTLDGMDSDSHQFQPSASLTTGCDRLAHGFSPVAAWRFNPQPA